MGCIIRIGIGFVRGAILWYTPWGVGTGGMDITTSFINNLGILESLMHNTMISMPPIPIIPSMYQRQY